MAFRDVREQLTHFTIVYAGPPTSGKTETVRALSQELRRENAVQSPEEYNGRTMYFDWLEYTGGYFMGGRLRCQILTVPGQRGLHERRKRLLELADSVVFVVNSRESEVEHSQAYLDEVRDILRRRHYPVGLVVQCNQQDREDALSQEEIRDRLGLSENENTYPTIATAGEGIRQSFLIGLRLAIDRAQQMLDAGERLSEHNPFTDGDALLALMLDGATPADPAAEQAAAATTDADDPDDAMVGAVIDLDLGQTDDQPPADYTGEKVFDPWAQEWQDEESGSDNDQTAAIDDLSGSGSAPAVAAGHEESAQAGSSQPEQPEAAASAVTPEPAAPLLSEPVSEPVEAEAVQEPPAAALEAGTESSPEPELKPAASADAPEAVDDKAVAALADDDVAPPFNTRFSRMVWPPVTGRAMLYRLQQATLPEQGEHTDRGWQWCGSGWRLFTHERWRYREEHETRVQLFHLGRILLAAEPLLAANRCFAISEEASGWYWIWELVTPPTATQRPLRQWYADADASQREALAERLTKLAVELVLIEQLEPLTVDDLYTDGEQFRVTCSLLKRLHEQRLPPLQPQAMVNDWLTQLETPVA
ncbi:MAG: hypothetical protein Tsb002_17140 [Wenzhouxiangellaceae bacterium]